jgi:ATPase subunit of ABC transporter with duplicated ATPase domains
VDEGALLLDGLLPEAWGPAAWRSRVCYVPQSRLRLPGSPADLFAEASRFAAQADRRAASPSAPAAAAACSPASPLDSVASSLLLDAGLVHRPWETLSGGQAARAALAVAMALDPPFLLVDEPTAALDASAAAAVERALAECGSAVLWVTHDEGQPGRVGGRVYDLVPGVVASRGGGERRGGGGESGHENDDGDNDSNSVPPVVVISPGRLVGGDWVGPKRGR